MRWIHLYLYKEKAADLCVVCINLNDIFRSIVQESSAFRSTLNKMPAMVVPVIVKNAHITSLKSLDPR
jgi:hypothetical protein